MILSEERFGSFKALPKAVQFCDSRRKRAAGKACLTGFACARPLDLWPSDERLEFPATRTPSFARVGHLQTQRSTVICGQHFLTLQMNFLTSSLIIISVSSSLGEIAASRTLDVINRKVKRSICRYEGAIAEMEVRSAQKQEAHRRNALPSLASIKDSTTPQKPVHTKRALHARGQASPRIASGRIAKIANAMFRAIVDPRYPRAQCLQPQTYRWVICI
jgi:hypothetical protein